MTKDCVDRCNGLYICLNAVFHVSALCRPLFTALAVNPLFFFCVFLQHCRMMLTREEAENACVGVAEGVSSACREALRATGLAAGDVDDVELLGGGSYIPALRRSVEEVFG